MAQRGGSVESHLRFGKKVFSPLIPAGCADFLVPFHADEEARLREMLSPRGTNLIGALGAAGSAVSDPRYLNIFLLGVLSRNLPIAREEWIKAIEHVLAKKNTGENVRVFLVGRGES